MPYEITFSSRYIKTKTISCSIYATPEKLNLRTSNRKQVHALTDIKLNLFDICRKYHSQEEACTRIRGHLP